MKARVRLSMGIWDALLGSSKRKAAVHELKWKLPEARLSVPVADANGTVAKLKKLGAKYLGGGSFHEVVHAKQFGEGVYGYFLVRTDPRTEKESLVFEGYMLDEEDKLNLSVESGFQIMNNLKSLGYEEAFERELTAWTLSWKGLAANVFQVKGFGSFLEVALPATKFQNARDLNQKTALDLIKKLGLREDYVLPTDVITLQYTAQQQEQGGAENTKLTSSTPTKPFALGSTDVENEKPKGASRELQEVRLEDAEPESVKDEKPAKGKGKNLF